MNEDIMKNPTFTITKNLLLTSVRIFNTLLSLNKKERLKGYNFIFIGSKQ